MQYFLHEWITWRENIYMEGPMLGEEEEIYRA